MTHTISSSRVNQLMHSLLLAPPGAPAFNEAQLRSRQMNAFRTAHPMHEQLLEKLPPAARARVPPTGLERAGGRAGESSTLMVVGEGVPFPRPSLNPYEAARAEIMLDDETHTMMQPNDGEEMEHDDETSSPMLKPAVISFDDVTTEPGWAVDAPLADEDSTSRKEKQTTSSQLESSQQDAQSQPSAAVRRASVLLRRPSVLSDASSSAQPHLISPARKKEIEAKVAGQPFQHAFKLPSYSDGDNTTTPLKPLGEETTASVSDQLPPLDVSTPPQTAPSKPGSPHFSHLLPSPSALASPTAFGSNAIAAAASAASVAAAATPASPAPNPLLPPGNLLEQLLSPSSSAPVLGLRSLQLAHQRAMEEEQARLDGKPIKKKAVEEPPPAVSKRGSLERKGSLEEDAKGMEGERVRSSQVQILTIEPNALPFSPPLSASPSVFHSPLHGPARLNTAQSLSSTSEVVLGEKERLEKERQEAELEKAKAISRKQYMRVAIRHVRTRLIQEEWFLEDARGREGTSEDPGELLSPDEAAARDAEQRLVDGALGEYEAQQIGQRYKEQILEHREKMREMDDVNQRSQQLERDNARMTAELGVLTTENQQLKSQLFDSFQIEKALKAQLQGMGMSAASVQSAAETARLESEITNLRATLATKENEHKELMAICTDLISQVETLKGAQPSG